MSDPITPESFVHLVSLAALELDLKESEYIRQQLNNQLKAIDELESIPLQENTQITSHGVAYTQISAQQARQDDLVFCQFAEDIIAQAPESEDGYIVVPDIPHTDLD